MVADDDEGRHELSTDPAVRRASVRVDGNQISYLTAGPDDGPPVVLVHGLLSDATTWGTVLPELGRLGLRAVAPDMLGAGRSSKPVDADYGIAALATSVHGLVEELAIDAPTLVGHSLGGGIAIAFSHLFPARAPRLVLVASGGFGTGLHPVLRAATLPGAPAALRLAAGPVPQRVLNHPRLHRVLGLDAERLANLHRIGRGLLREEGRAAFFSTLHESIDRSGQRGSMVEMGFVNADLPTLLVWAERDPIIPVSHAHTARDYLRDARLELLPGVGHEPHRKHPARVAGLIADFARGQAGSASGTT